MVCVAHVYTGELRAAIPLVGHAIADRYIRHMYVHTYTARSLPILQPQ